MCEGKDYIMMSPGSSPKKFSHLVSKVEKKFWVEEPIDNLFRCSVLNVLTSCQLYLRKDVSCKTANMPKCNWDRLKLTMSQICYAMSQP